MQRLPAERQAIINAIALRQGTAQVLAARFQTTTTELRQFALDNREAIEKAHERLTQPEQDDDGKALTPTQLDELWITNKFERLKRLQDVAEDTYEMIIDGDFISNAEQSMAVREFRSYLMLAANELGQLLHRGSGDGAQGDSLNVEIMGVDMDTLR